MYIPTCAAWHVYIYTDCPYNSTKTTSESTRCDRDADTGVAMAMTSHDGIMTSHNDVVTSHNDAMTTVECRLETKQLWDKFHELGTEMIITKSGRYAFYQKLLYTVFKNVFYHLNTLTLTIKDKASRYMKTCIRKKLKPFLYT